MIPISFTRPSLWFSAVVIAIVAMITGFLIWISVQDTEPNPVPMSDMMQPPGIEGD